jgi:hypothetical protein
MTEWDRGIRYGRPSTFPARIALHCAERSGGVCGTVREHGTSIRDIDRGPNPQFPKVYTCAGTRAKMDVTKLIFR